jgi:tRNA-dihydrouridine synthase A
LTAAPPHTFSVAPMMDWTDRRCRAFHRALSKHALLYTEMVTEGAIHFGDRERLLGFDAVEHPVALQLGGSNPERLASAAKIGADWGYDEINLNVGCPSDRVQEGRFGACLMREPALVAECIAAMKARVSVPVTVKHRLGVDDQDPETTLFSFVETVAAAGCTTFIVHARKAWLKGLSPKENRDVPPLDYDIVWRLKAARPDLSIILNGGLETLEQARAETATLDGAMLGRAAYHDPGILGSVDRIFFGKSGTDTTPEEAIETIRPMIEADLARGTPLHVWTRHMLGLFRGQSGARLWRRILGEEGRQRGAGLEVLDRGLEAIRVNAFERDTEAA